MIWLADIVLAVHFAIAAYTALGLVLVPVGGLLGWRWIRSRQLRTLHAGLMVFVAAEAVVGMTCPLTLLEAGLRGSAAPEWFWADQLSRLLYWDLPPSFFLGLYVLCAVWVVCLWFLFPPTSKASFKASS
jgi:hypothetical protein